MFNVELNEEMVGKVNVSIKVLDALYTSESDFDECVESLRSLANSFKFGELLGMSLDKESFKKLRDSMQEDIDEYNKKKVDERITDFLN
ncbi:hypothetical protein [uncultured Granulicatella sp.]|uniref:hypothetical protein n=1 Tax=uncultured Granulicatella sp. TaxID=316089 RepID=UPI00204B1A53|nr:hypothetical protein [uncultured Granulicatella sp.]DAM48582.1 MAG TPA: hypothetical protein [Caudoviricetes sp.]